jgi:amino acid adenylation domain-containing protein
VPEDVVAEARRLAHPDHAAEIGVDSTLNRYLDSLSMLKLVLALERLRGGEAPSRPPTWSRRVTSRQVAAWLQDDVPVAIAPAQRSALVDGVQIEPRAAIPANTPILGRFFEHVARAPDAPALFVDGCLYSYAELARAVGRLTNAIASVEAKAGASLGEIGAVVATRTLTAYAGYIALLCAGKAYLPIPDNLPSGRAVDIFAQSKARVLIVSGEDAERVPSMLAQTDREVAVIFADREELPAWTANHPPHRFISALSPEHDRPWQPYPAGEASAMAYLLFTSGTTGRPKGVAITRANLQALVDNALVMCEPRPTDRFAQHAGCSFDISMFDLWAAWSSGASVYVLVAEALTYPGEFIRKHALTVWNSVPTVITMMTAAKALAPGSLPSLRCSIFVGEALLATAAEAWQRATPGGRVLNCYGPTEATVFCSVYEWRKDRSPAEIRNGVVPIGHAFPGQTLVAVGERGEILPPGEVGELYIAGSQLSPGYYEQEELTAARFVALPGAQVEPNRWYRTGDRVEADRDAGFHFLGRVDHQIKIRGYRIELAEIEHVLCEITGAEQVVVLGWPLNGPANAAGLVAFATSSKITPALALEQSHETLPNYMVPSRLIIMQALPIGATGKVDRQRLLEQLDVSDAS